jgi:chitinase
MSEPKGLRLSYPLLLLTVIITWLLPLTTLAQVPGGGGICSDTIPCEKGCCSKNNQCGFTPEHCGDGCKHNCDAKADCGQYAPPGQQDCPINVCCR